jgi:hypothetical protein
MLRGHARAITKATVALGIRPNRLRSYMPTASTICTTIGGIRLPDLVGIAWPVTAGHTWTIEYKGGDMFEIQIWHRGQWQDDLVSDDTEDNRFANRTDPERERRNDD